MTTTTESYATDRPAARRLPWNVMAGGLALDHTDYQAAMIEAGLDFTSRVIGAQAVDDDGTTYPAPQNRAVVRPGPGGLGTQVVAMTGKRFTPIQNRDAFSVAGVLTAEFGARIIGGADFRGGGASLMVVDLAQPVVLTRPDGREDRLDLDLLVKNAHDGSSALTFALTPVRFACTNALQAAIGKADRVWKVSHTPNAAERVNLAHQSILNALTYRDAFQATAQAMMDQAMADAEFDKIVSRLWPVAEGREDTRAGQARLETRTQVQDLYRSSETLEGVRGTLWGGYNAITEWLDWERPVRGGEVSRAEGALEGKYVRDKAATWSLFAAAV